MEVDQRVQPEQPRLHLLQLGNETGDGAGVVEPPLPRVAEQSDAAVLALLHAHSLLDHVPQLAGRRLRRRADDDSVPALRHRAQLRGQRVAQLSGDRESPRHLDGGLERLRRRNHEDDAAWQDVLDHPLWRVERGIPHVLEPVVEPLFTFPLFFVLVVHRTLRQLRRRAMFRTCTSLTPNRGAKST